MDLVEDQPVGGQLLQDELRVGLVGIEGVHDVVAVRPGVGVPRVLPIGRVPLGVRVAGDIEPVAPPPLPVMGRGKEPVDDPLPGLRRIIRQKRLHLSLGRGQADQVKGDPADEGALVRLRVGNHLVRLQLGENEGVHRRLAPGRVRDRGHGLGTDGLERPMVPSDTAVGRAAPLRYQGPGVGCPAAHPLDQVRDLAVGKLLALGGHLQVLVLVGNRVDQEAVGGLSRDQGGAGVAAVEKPLPRVEHEPALHLVGVPAVALVATGDEHRPHLLLEEDPVVVGKLLRGVGSPRQDGHRHDPQDRDPGAQCLLVRWAHQRARHFSLRLEAASRSIRRHRSA